MMRIILGLMVFAGSAFGQEEKPPVDTAKLVDAFKKEAPQLQASVDEMISSVLPGPAGLMGRPKATYLEGYGVVVLAEVELEATRNPFSSPKTPKEVRAIVDQRKKLVQDKLGSFLRDQIGKMQSLGDTDSLTIALQLFNANPADVPDLKSQLILTIKKQDPTQVVVREF